MKENEFRIGNLVIDCHGEPCSIIGINKTGTIRCDNGSVQSIENIHAVKPTEEVLIKFGFKKSIGNGALFYSLPEIKSEVHFEKYGKDYVCVVYSSTGSFVPIDMKGMHQVQNLCFAMSGRELALV